MNRTDMTPRAITVRLRRVSQLRRLGLSLKKAKITQPQGDAKTEPSRASLKRGQSR